MKRMRLVGTLGGLMLLAALAAGPASATHVDPVVYEGNPTCVGDNIPPRPAGEELGFNFGYKVDPPAEGTFTNLSTPPLDAENGAFITVSNLTATTFDWSSNLEILAVIVKGGPNANVYFYNPPATFADEDLTTVGDGGFDISHIEFCYDDPTVPQGEPLGVEKTAAGTSELKYTWDIDKDVDQTTQTGTPPGTVTFNYTVTVSHDAGVESGFAVTGVIKVTNANAYDVTLVDITDELDDGTVCDVTGGVDATIPASDSADFAYSCAPADDSATENTVSVSWPDQAGPPMLPAGHADFTAPVSWTQDVIDECIDVNDSYAGFLGTVCVGDANPTTFDYSRDIAIPEFGCIEVDNTADFVTNDTQTTGEASQTVEVCSSFEGCTPGFWKNHTDAWHVYTTGQTVGSVFTGATTANSNSTLLQALSFKGGNTIAGAQQILLRAGVAALLNSTDPDVDYMWDTATVIAKVNAALASGDRATILAAAAELDEANNAGCPL